MHQLEDKKGLDLQWWAITHRNTDNHHVHVVVLSKDKYGRQVRFDKSDYQLMKQHGDRYLERVHTYEFREAQRAREEKQRQQTKERRQQRERDRQERIQRGEELPGLHKKIVREQLTPYKETQEKLPRLTRKNADKTPPSFEYQGERYSRDDSREHLSGLMRRCTTIRTKSSGCQRKAISSCAIGSTKKTALGSPVKLIASFQLPKRDRQVRTRQRLRLPLTAGFRRCKKSYCAIPSSVCFSLRQQSLLRSSDRFRSPTREIG